MSFKGKTKSVTFQKQKLVIQGMSVYRAICLRGKITGEGDETEDNLKIMAEVISECVTQPKMTVEECLNLDVEVFRDLFQIVAENNGLIVGNVPKPKKT